MPRRNPEPDDAVVMLGLMLVAAAVAVFLVYLASLAHA